MGYELVNHKDKGWFYSYKVKRRDDSLEYLLDKYNINLDDYYILKQSGKFRFLDIEDRYKYAGITCFSKDRFSKGDIDKWLDLIYGELDLTINFLTRPFPDISLMNKIRVIEWDIK